MPPLQVLSRLASRTAASITSSTPAPSATGQPLRVVCAWPVSSQYGAGSRFLYYVIVAACVLLRKNEQLREASLAAALVIPAISSLHGLVLSSYHVNGAVDFDIFGAFQLCSIAMLAAPLTVRISQTYFFAQGRNIIFLWTMLMVAGLISLCIEFYRVTATDCPSVTSTKGFRYGEEMCGMICSEDKGPFSPMRGGSASNIYVVPVPSRLTFNAAMLLAAGICIPAILSLLFTADKILEVNWKRRKGTPQPGDQVEGGNITVRELNNINKVVTKFLSVIEIPVFGGAVLAITIIGEINFFSTQLMYQTEPMASIGQWSPIAGTCIAALGSLLVYVTSDRPSESIHSDHSQCDHSRNQLHHHLSPDTVRDGSPARRSNERSLGSRNSHELHNVPTIEEPPVGSEERLGTQRDSPEAVSNAGRSTVRKWLEKASIYVSDVAHDRLDTSDFPDTRARRYPWVPGEEFRNMEIYRTSTHYDTIREQRSRAASYAPSVASTSGAERASPSPQPASLRHETSPLQTPVRRDTLTVPAPAHTSPRLGNQHGWS